MDDFKAIAELFGLDASALGIIAGFLFIWIAFLKSQFPKMRGVYTTIATFLSSGLCTYAFMIQTQTFNLIGFLLSTVICWIGAAGFKAATKALSNGGETKHSPAFKVKVEENAKKEE